MSWGHERKGKHGARAGAASSLSATIPFTLAARLQRAKDPQRREEPAQAAWLLQQPACNAPWDKAGLVSCTWESWIHNFTLWHGQGLAQLKSSLQC